MKTNNTIKDFLQLVRKMREAQSSGYVRKGVLGPETSRMIELEEMVDLAVIEIGDSITRKQPVIDDKD